MNFSKWDWWPFADIERRDGRQFQAGGAIARLGGGASVQWFLALSLKLQKLFGYGIGK